MTINFITLFPERIESYFCDGLQKKAIEKGIFNIRVVYLRDFSLDKFGRVDDTIYGGGPGMLLKIEPIERALESLGESKGIVCLMSASGKVYNQEMANYLQSMDRNITLISGYFEGVDYRVVENFVDMELSLGEFVLSCGDLAALCIADSVVRLIPGFMGEAASLEDESHNVKGLLEYPQYTRPSKYKGWLVPEILLSGNHKEIKNWKENNKRRL
ncbi:MAG: tRNA (guanosine(37)-N1)-methyltransferase TrmD [Leptospiraceae bacterium]|nr:tRNA (guanosine(37)-N1)-methyltransferase TrmD [Leptospiraceae bacterium]MCP5495424.1 tRNA (guanosine(37)-N1)-methyltransferase TrmD [Leptospiraceae bacterium]